MKILSYDNICELAFDYRNIETFGPNTETPCLTIQLDRQVPKYVSDFLKTMPCPVIGLGPDAFHADCDVCLPDTRKLSRIFKNIAKTPYAAMVLVQHLRASQTQSVEHALMAESLAYGVVQNGSEFKRWLETRSHAHVPPKEHTQVAVNISDNILNITLTDPTHRNAISKDTRDALCDAFDIAGLDETIREIVFSGSGRTFSAGGDLAEFGTISDPTSAHWIRSLRQPANRLAQLRQKLVIHVNGAAIGAGAEMAAFGRTVTATSHAWFQLPELKYGLLPGAGGTVSLPRRIGRQRTAYMALSMERIRARRALEWGLIDAISDAPPDI